MARTKGTAPIFPNDKLSQHRLEMLRHVFPDCNEEDILGKALDMFWREHEQKVNDFVKSLSSYASYTTTTESPDATK